MNSIDIDRTYTKQILLISNKLEPVREMLTAEGYYVTWCPFDLDKIMKLRDHSNIMIINTEEENEEELKRIGLYLRDMCIAEEKILYIYGRIKGVNIIRSRVPSLYVRKAVYVHSEPFSVILKDLKDIAIDYGLNQKGILIIDNDSEYIEKLRPNLDPYFRVYVNHNNLKEAERFLQISDIVLLNVDEACILREYIELFKSMIIKRKSSGLRLYYLTANNEDRDRMNMGIENDAIALSKSADVSKTAAFIINILR